MSTRKRRLILDIETKAFTKKFKHAKSDAARIKHCPEIRLSGVYDALARTYTFYTLAQSKYLIRHLFQADEIVTFNGNRFDFLVLLRHGGLSERRLQMLQSRHFDLYEAILQMTQRSFKLDALARANFNERKLVSGREMSRLDLNELKKANQSDLRHTYRLWQLHRRGRLVLPEYDVRREHEGWQGGPHSLLPPGDYIDCSLEDMTEGQMAEYLAGTWGITKPTPKYPVGRLVEM
jgi:hypothetical protein